MQGAPMGKVAPLRRVVAIAGLAANFLAVACFADSKPTGDPADVDCQEAVYVGSGGSYTLDRDAAGNAAARATIVLKSRTDQYEAFETPLKFESGMSLRLDGWKGTYK